MKVTSASKKIYQQEVEKIRKINFENLELREYLIRGIRKAQKSMDANCLIGLSEKEKEKVRVIETFVVRNGRALGKRDVMDYVNQIDSIEQKFPDDYLCRIMAI